MRKSKNEIIKELAESFQLLCTVAASVPESDFNVSQEGKWTAAENIKHILTGTKMTAYAYNMPGIIHRALYGKPHRASHGFSKLVDDYHQTLNRGGKASGVYVPKKADYKKGELIASLQKAGEALTASIKNKWTDERLDLYQVNHPLLGLLTLRELAYFTIYHNGHHTETIKKFYAPGNRV